MAISRDAKLVGLCTVAAIWAYDSYICYQRFNGTETMIHGLNAKLESWEKLVGVYNNDEVRNGEENNIPARKKGQ